MISSYHVNGHGSDDRARLNESLSLNFTKITFEMSRTSPDITHSQGYQLSQQPNWTGYP
jgi:type VI protein secretion system component Hcp